MGLAPPFLILSIEQVKSQLQAAPKAWFVTGVAGFIGSNLLEALLRLDQTVVGLDNFSTGHARNLKEVQSLVTPAQWGRFRLIEADLRDLPACRRACVGVDYVLHHAALGSVPRSMEEPLVAHEVNVTGTLHVFLAARDQGIKRCVYASSSAVYGDHPGLPKVEAEIGRPLSPYAATKLTNELYADTFARCYGLETIGLRYFNVFGPRQDPEGAYAAVIPKWIAAFLRDQPIHIHGDGETSRDFCYVTNVVQANLLAATAANAEALGRVYNVALNERTTLTQLFFAIRNALAAEHPKLAGGKPVYGEFRPGDVRHSQADIAQAQRLLGYGPTHSLAQGLEAALGWYKKNVV